MRAFKVFTIKNGTVIDHIPAGQAIRLIRMLKLIESGNFVTMGANFKSKKRAKKDLIKIEDKELTPEDVNQVALIAPEATINIIRDFKIVKKYTAELPEVFENIGKCPNPKCITNMDPEQPKFYPLFKNNEMQVKCHYCEKLFSPDEIK
ncbi:MAG: aspartate carbamoyltransferase regulatory subunit [Candidatus Kerfeldbacteria bacterium]